MESSSGSPKRQRSAVVDFTIEIYNIWLSERPTQLAAALAYFGLFSFAPVIYIAFLVAGIFVDRSALLERVIGRVTETLGPGIALVIQQLIDSLANKSPGGSFLVSLVSFIAILLAASGVFYQLQFVLNKIWRVPYSTDQAMLRTIRKQLFAFVMVIALGILLIALAVFSFLASWLSNFFAMFGFSPSLTLLGFFIFAALTFAVMYKVLPDVKVTWRDIWVGAIIASLLVTAGGWLVAFFIKKTTFASALEATGSFIILLTGFYYFAQIFLLGAIITRIYTYRYGSMRQSAVKENQTGQPGDEQSNA